jgi:hypothetical protein
MSETEYAWVAGIIDGEGCIIIKKTKPSLNVINKSICHSVQVRVHMTHKPTLDKIEEIFPRKRKYVYKCKYKQNRHRQSWSLVYSGKDAYELLDKISPYIVTKAEEVKLALKFRDIGCYKNKGGIPNEVIIQREEIYVEMRNAKKVEFDN